MYFDLPLSTFNVWWLKKDIKSSTIKPFIFFKDSVIRLFSSFTISINLFNILKWNEGVNIFRLSCHFVPEIKRHFSNKNIYNNRNHYTTH